MGFWEQQSAANGISSVLQGLGIIQATSTGG